MTECFNIFAACAEAIAEGELIESVSAKDKEFHFQNWFQKRLDTLRINFDCNGRNTYPDFRMVKIAEGYEVKGLAWPGREKDYDANSQVPSGLHNGREIFYVFGRYPSDLSEYEEKGYGRKQYPVVDFVMCHGDFLNADHEYEHKNKSVKGFGTYGDIMIRDRKMYVAPTPFALTEGTTGLVTLIVPKSYASDDRFQNVGELIRKETEYSVTGYSFNLKDNEMNASRIINKNAGKEHAFSAYRLKTQSKKKVCMSKSDNEKNQ